MSEHLKKPQHEIDTVRMERIAQDILDNATAGAGGGSGKHACTQGDILDQINQKLDEIISRLAKGDTAIALLEHRVAFMEKIVYGMCGLILVAVIGAIIALVVKGHP